MRSRILVLKSLALDPWDAVIDAGLPISKLAGCSRRFVVLEQESGHVVVLDLQMLECGLRVNLLAEVSITIQITVPAFLFYKFAIRSSASVNLSIVECIDFSTKDAVSVSNLMLSGVHILR